MELEMDEISRISAIDDGSQVADLSRGAGEPASRENRHTPRHSVLCTLHFELVSDLLPFASAPVLLLALKNSTRSRSLLSGSPKDP